MSSAHPGRAVKQRSYVKSQSMYEGMRQSSTTTTTTVPDKVYSADTSSILNGTRQQTHSSNGAFPGGQGDCNTELDVRRGRGAVENPSDEESVIHNMKKRLSDNLEHYSSVFQGIALPMLFRRSGRGRGKARSRSQSRSHSRSRDGDRNHNKRDNKNANRKQDAKNVEDEYVFVEHIELHHMDGFVFSSSREIGTGHHFQILQLNSPTWCDKCGDFIWGMYKQCLQCDSE